MNGKGKYSKSSTAEEQETPLVTLKYLWLQLRFIPAFLKMSELLQWKKIKTIKTSGKKLKQ